MMKIALIAGFAVSAANAQMLTGVEGLGDNSGNQHIASNLWDQAPDAAQPGFVNQEFGDFPSFSTYIVSDVSFADPVEINDVTTYFTIGFGLWPTSGSGSGNLNIFPKSGTLPGGGDDPTGGMSVTVDYSTSGTGIDVTASGLSINLPAGDYWVGLTPVLDFGTFGQEFQLGSSSIIGDASAGRNPGGGFGIGFDWVDAGVTFGGVSDWNAAISIGGVVVPAPATLALLGAGGLVAARRRR